jgi:hypothetical protein
MGSPNGGIIGVINPTSFGKDTVTSKTSSGDLTTQPGTRLVNALVVAGGGGGGGSHLNYIGGGGGAGGANLTENILVCGATVIQLQLEQEEQQEDLDSRNCGMEVDLDLAQYCFRWYYITNCGGGGAGGGPPGRDTGLPGGSGGGGSSANPVPSGVPPGVCTTRKFRR